MDFFLQYYWELFILIEILFVVCILFFGLFRYYFQRKKISFLFLILFFLLLMLEGLLGYFVYQRTGEISTFLLIVIVFILYACTFGIFDFLKLDRWMRLKIGRLQGVELLTEQDYQQMQKQRNPQYLAKKYRRSSLIHCLIFLTVQSIFWWMGTGSVDDMLLYIKNLSWLKTNDVVNSPYPNETIYTISIIWGIILIADLLYAWSYTLFPKRNP